MRKLHRVLVPALALLLGAAAPATAEAHAVVVAAPTVRAWVPGHWVVRLGRRVWVEGHFAAEPAPPPARVWVPGHWVGRGRARHWVPGHWELRP